MDIEIHIEELILEGFPAGDRHSIGEAIGRELTRLLGEQDVPSVFSRSGEFGRLDGGSFKVAPGTNGEAVGRQVAQTICQGAGKWV